MPFPQKLYRVTNSNISNSTVRTFSSFLPLFTHLIARLSHRRRLENIRFRVFFFGDFNVSDLHRAFECEALRFPPQPGIEAAEETVGFRVPQVRCKLRLNYINRGEQNEKTAYSKARLARACKLFIVHGGGAALAACGKTETPEPTETPLPAPAVQTAAPETVKRTRGGEALVKAVSDKTGKAFGSVKIAFDACCVALAVALSFILCGEILEVREGTLVAALLTGVFVNLFGRLFTSFGNAESPAV